MGSAPCEPRVTSLTACRLSRRSKGGAIVCMALQLFNTHRIRNFISATNQECPDIFGERVRHPVLSWSAPIALHP